MKNKLTAGILGITALFLAVFLIPNTTLAAQPTLVLSNQGNNSVLVSSYGDQNAAVTLYYANSGNGSYTSVGSIGWTNQAGTFSTTLNYNSYNIASGAAVYVVVNGQQSPTTYWPSNNNCYNCYNNYGNISLSQTNLSLNQGQTSSITIYNNNNNGYYNNSYYVSNNSYSNIADVTVSGSLITVRANNLGTATFSICGYNNSGCATLYVTVAQNYNNNYSYNGYQYVYLNPTSNGYYGNNSLIFQPSVVTIGRNQTMSYTMSAQNYGYSYNTYYPTTSMYYVTNNTKPGAASVLVSNNNLFIQGLKKGTTAATVCRNDGYCGTLTITVQ